MDKKQFTSWGVSFGSLALVAGMVSYLGLMNKNTTNKINGPVQSQSQPASKSLDQNSIPQNGDDQNSFSSPSNSDGTSASTGDDQTTNSNQPTINFGNGSTNSSGQPPLDNGSSVQNNNQTSGQGFGNHRQFDTTTGGT